ncbi:Polysaccharide deacetylase [Fibrobacter sp. UWT3]|uniref:polysaccharide deacetylase family protein n=1 Tax=Fibrobacter sp. UWT3 TaxID=1896225 RepID=UPI000BD740ED|nr:polysaccharide deacetylase family protein [Fibrobacter sp. UWT3]SOE79429.1 Polysaccharide deacetylase [Fibrobacter sp. UWT3]
MKKILFAASAVGLFAVGSAFAQSVEIATWSGFRKGAASFTFDDGAPSHVSDAGPMFKKYGYKATFNVVVNWNPNWSGFQGLADEGHEIASHSNSHGNNMSGEEASSKKSIEGKINQKYGVITVAYPNCNVPNESAVLQNYIVGRICNGSWKGMNDEMGKDGPSNWAQVPATMTGAEGQLKSTNDFTGRMQKVIQSNGWAAFLTHGFQGKQNGNANYSPTDINAIDGALKWAQQNDKDIWVAPMGHVAMYLKERKASKAEVSTSGGNITVKLTHNIKDNISNYDYPLSLRVKYSGSTANVTQAGAKLESKIDGGYVYFDAVPNAGDIVIAGEGGSGPTPESSSSIVAESSSSKTAKSSSSRNNPWERTSSSSQTNPWGPWNPQSSSGTDAIEDIAFTNQHFSVYRSSDNYIVVGGAQGMPITVYNHMGQVVRVTRGLGFEQKVYSGAKGAYIVRVGNRTFKVSL